MLFRLGDIRSRLTGFAANVHKASAVDEAIGGAARTFASYWQDSGHFRALIENALDLILIVGRDCVIRYASPSVEQTLGYTWAHLAERDITELLHPDDAALFGSEIVNLIRTSHTISPASHRWRHLDGSYRVLESTATNQLANPSIAGLVLHSRDITEWRNAEAQVQELNAKREQERVDADKRSRGVDALTGLPDRARLHEQLEHVIRNSRLEKGQCALLLLDLDRFKDINDALGHQVGDSLLQQISQRLRSAMQAGEVVARLGGDEFAALLSYADGDRATQVAGNIVQILQAPFNVEGKSIVVDVSIGIAIVPQHGQDADAVMRRADIAMYQAKRSGIGVAVYSRGQDEHRPDRLALLSDLRGAIERDELLLHYQPKISLRNGIVTDVEALVRWQHPERGFLSPTEFMPLAEQSGLIHPLSLWVLEEALRQQKVWRDQGRDIAIAVNLSQRMLHDVRLSDTVSELLRLWDTPPSALVLEITESSLMADPVRAQQYLKQLRALGVLVSIDDFGTGYSSLASLKNLSVDELKIDQSFVRAMATEASSRAIVRAIIDLADALKLRVVAEGVEDRATWDVLVSLGCDAAQGYLLSEPLASAELEAWIARVAPTWIDVAGRLAAEDPLKERIRSRGARLTAEEEFLARKQSEAALLASEERTRLALQAAQMGTWDFDIVNNIHTWSAETEALFGLEPGAFAGNLQNFQVAIHPDDWPTVSESWRTAFLERSGFIAVYRAMWPDGSTHWIEDKGRGLYAPDGTPLRMSGTAVDVTERKLAADALRASEERFRMQYKGNPLPTYCWDQVGDDFVLTDYNYAAEAVVGRGIADWLGVRASIRYLNEPGIVDDLKACVAEQHVIRTDVCSGYPTTGSECDLAVTYVFIPPSSVMIHTEDITGAKRVRRRPA